MSTAVLIIFGLVYLGMVLGEIPGLALDRTGVALLGAIAMVVVVVGALPFADAWTAVDMPTLHLLFALMVSSAQFRLAGAKEARRKNERGLRVSSRGGGCWKLHFRRSPRRSPMPWRSFQWP